MWLHSPAKQAAVKFRARTPPRWRGVSESRPADPPEAGIDNARLRESQLLLMHATDERILDHANTLAETLQFIVTQTRQILNAQQVDILFEYPDGLRNEISTDPEQVGLFVPFDRSIAGLVLTRQEPVLINDIHSDPLLREKYIPRVTQNVEVNSPHISVIAAELTLDGQGIGVISIEGTPENRFGIAHLDFVNSVARQISMAITHAALFDEDSFRNATDQLLMEASTTDSGAVMRQVLEQILSTLRLLTFLKVDAAEILFADPNDQDRLLVAYSTNNADIGVRVAIESSVCGEAFRSGRTVLVQRTFERADYRPVAPGMKCEIAIPIVFGSSNLFPIGVLNLESSRENAFSTVGMVLAERFTRGIVNALAMTKIRADIDSELQDQFMVLAADLVLNAVHRINNHVGSIRALAQDLLEDLDSQNALDTSDLAGRLSMIQFDADRALEIPVELLKRIGTPSESTDVNAQVEAGLERVRIPKHIELVMDLAPGLPSIPCTALDLVVENLLLNAVKAMQGRPGPLRVMTRLDDRLPREPFITVSVQDTGAGMTQEELARLFEPRKGGRRGSGLGFGMTWVRSWVRRSRGLIDVESQPGSGTTVTIRFQIDPQLIGRAPSGGEST
jgi:signal transduction histidine kinase